MLANVSLAQDWHHRLLKKQFAHLHIVKITLNIFPRYPGKFIAHLEEVPITPEPGKYTLGPVFKNSKFTNENTKLECYIKRRWKGQLVTNTQVYWALRKLRRKQSVVSTAPEVLTEPLKPCNLSHAHMHENTEQRENKEAF